MDAVVVGRFDPRGERSVEFQQRLGRGHDRVADLLGGAVFDLDEELVPHAAEPAFDLAPPLLLAGTGVDQPDPEHRAGPQQPVVDERGPVVDVDRAGPLQRGAQQIDDPVTHDRIVHVREP